MKTYIIYYTYLWCIVAAFSSVLLSCSSALEGQEAEIGNGKTLLSVKAGINQASTSYVPFKKEDIIRIYYAAENLSKINIGYQGLYQITTESPSIESPWTNCNKSDKNIHNLSGIYVDDIINYPNIGSNGYYFTAVSYPEPISTAHPTFYNVNANQNTEQAYSQSDFLVSRAIYNNKDWGTNGLTFHFWHVLSQLRVKLIIPEGDDNDGGFVNAKNLTIPIAIMGKHTHYTVNYSSSNTNQTPMVTELPKQAETGNPSTENIQMYQHATPTEATMSGRKAWCYTFTALLPVQSMYNSTAPLLTFKIGTKEYQFIPQAQNTVQLAQAKITTVTFTVMSGVGNQQVALNAVTIEDWVTDKATIGDLTPQ